jgi:hypothetical protein
VFSRSGGGVVALSGVLTGTTTGAPSIPLMGPEMPEADSLVADISAAITTSSLVVVVKWQVSNDNSTFRDIYDSAQTAYAQVAPTGSGSLVTTAFKVAAPKGVMSYPYARVAIASSGATGAAGDNVTAAYSYLKRG